jgi:hypothetical protein
MMFFQSSSAAQDPDEPGSILATYGVLVRIFQDGWGAGCSASRR